MQHVRLGPLVSLWHWRTPRALGMGFGGVVSTTSLLGSVTPPPPTMTQVVHWWALVGETICFLAGACCLPGACSSFTHSMIDHRHDLYHKFMTWNTIAFLEVFAAKDLSARCCGQGWACLWQACGYCAAL